MLSKRENEILEIKRLEEAESKTRTKENQTSHSTSHIGFKFDNTAMDAIDEFVNQAKNYLSVHFKFSFI